jgi:ribose transport system ATP-binding protein
MAERVDSLLSTPRLQMQGINKHFGATNALEDVNIQVASGEVLALVGENGAGKSTLMKICSGAVKPDMGRMWLDGRIYRPASPLEARKAGVAMIYQELSLAPHLTVEENITLGVEPARLGVIRWNQVRRRTIEAIRYFDNPELKPDIRVNKLSIGAQQLVEIARALAIGCRVLVFDEPTSSLTQQDVGRLFGLIERLKQQGKAIIYISHFIEEVKRVADRVAVLRDGKMVGVSNVSDITSGRIIQMMVGRKVEDLYPRTKRQAGEVVLEVKDLAGVRKPQSASLQLHRGEVLGIAGLIGAGRTEFLRSLFGLDAVRHGQIRLGVYAGPASPVRRWMQGAGFLSEDRKEEGLALSLSVADNITLSRLKGFGPFGLVLPSRQEKAVRRWLGRLDIRCRGPRQSVSSLSGGNQQKVALARLMQHDADVLLLDEPTRGIDVAAKVTIYTLINELAGGSATEGRQPKAVLVVSSYLPELLGICDRIAVMCRGRLGPTHRIEDVDEHKLMLEATGRQETNE